MSHRTDMLTLLSDVRYREQNRKHLLAASISPFDPSRTFGGKRPLEKAGAHDFSGGLG